MRPEVNPDRASQDQPVIKNIAVDDKINLVRAKVGKPYRILGINGGCEVRTRLASMGILPGQEIRVLNPASFGPIMISIKGSRVALGHGVCNKILVRPQTAPPSV